MFRRITRNQLAIKTKIENGIHKSKSKETLLKLISISIGFTASLSLLELVTRLIPASDGVSIATPLECNNIESPTLKCVFRRPPNRRYLYTKGKLPPLPIKAVKKSNDIGQFSDVSWAQFTNSRAKDTIRVLAVGDSFVEADQVENHQTFHGLLNRTKTSDGRRFLSTAIGANGNSFPQYLIHLAFAKKQLGTARVYVVIPIIPNDYSDAFFNKSALKTGSYFTKQKTSNRFSILFEPYKSSPALSARRFAINASSLFRYLIYNLEISRLAFKYPFCYLSGAKCISHVESGNADFAPDEAGERGTHKDATDYFFRGLGYLRKTNQEKQQTIFLLDCQRAQIYNPKGHQPACTDERYRYFKKIALAKGYRVIDMKPIFSKYHTSTGERLEFSNDFHWNRIAHKLASHETANLISKDNDVTTNDRAIIPQRGN